MKCGKYFKCVNWKWSGEIVLRQGFRPIISWNKFWIVLFLFCLQYPSIFFARFLSNLFALDKEKIVPRHEICQTKSREKQLSGAKAVWWLTDKCYVQFQDEIHLLIIEYIWQNIWPLEMMDSSFVDYKGCLLYYY